MTRLSQRVEKLEGGSAANPYEHLTDKQLKESLLETLTAIQKRGALTSPEWSAVIDRVRTGGEWFSSEEFAGIVSEVQRLGI